MAYNSRSRAAAQQQTPPWVPTAVAIITSTIGLALLYFGLPGFVVVWLGLTVAAWSAVPPLMTGKDPATKAPIPQGPREEKQYQQFQFWRSLKWGLVFPVSSAWPGIPPRAAFFGSLLTAATAACLPAFDLPAQYPALLLPVANALFAFITVSQLCAARRDTVAKSDRSPGVKFHHVLRIGYSDKTGLTDTKVRAAFLGGGFLAGVVSAVAAHLYAPAPAWLPGFLAAAAWPLIGFCSGFAAVTARPWVDVSLEHWRMVGAARDEWAPRWTMLKQQAAPPRLNDRQFCGPAVIDSFTADGMMGGSNTYLALTQKIIPTMGRSVRLAVLPSPSRDSSGQPMPGTIDANDFQIVVWPADFQISLADPSVDPDLAKLWLECALAWVCEGLSLPPIVDQMTPLGVPSESAPVFLIDPDTEEPVTDPETGEPVIDPNAPVTTTDIESQAYAITLHMPAGPGYETMRKMLIGPLAGWCGAEALCDHRGGALYVGALTEGQPEFDPSTGVTVEALRQLDTEDTWNTRWAAVLKQDVNPPTIDFRTTTEEAILGGAVIKRQAFIPRQGVDLRDFFNLEPKIAATIAGAPFVYVSGWIQSAQPNGRKGERHAQAFQVCWSNAALPPNPDELRPLSAPPRPGDPGSRGRNPRDPRDPRNPRDPRGARGPAGQTAPMPAHNNAYLWLLGGRISQAFRAARLAQPETYAIRCLTSPRSRGHIWACSVRLYEGVTLADVRGAAQRLRQAIGSEWLRVEALDDGCTIVVGASPSRVTLADPERDTRYLANLDWQQAFLDSKVSGVGGLTPEVISVETLPANPQVSCTTFTLPSGLSMADVSAQKAKLETATGNAFIEVRESARGLATEMRILSSEVNPMPEQAPVDFEVMDTADGIPFATGVEGEPLIFDPKDSPHALLAGVTGAGKSVLITNFVYGFLLRGADVYVIDPVKGGADFAWAREHCRAFATTPFEAAGLLKNVIYAEVVRRKNLASQHGVASYLDLPEKLPPIVVVLDEFTSLMGRAPVPPASDDPEAEAERALLIAENTARANIGTFTGKLAREARSAGVTVLLGTQKLSAKMLDSVPGGSDLKSLSLDTRLPVPVSDRFPTGWATVAELVEGDLLYAPDGSPTSIIGFTEVPQGHDVYEVTFDDGQVIKAGADHGWLASDNRSRKEFLRKRYGHKDEGRPRPERITEYEYVRAVTSTISDDIYATAGDISSLLGFRNARALTVMAAQAGLPRFDRHPVTGEPVPQAANRRRGSAPVLWHVDTAMQIVAHRDGVQNLATLAGTWATARTLIETMTGRSVAPVTAGNLGTALKAAGCPSKPSDHTPTLFRAVDMAEMVVEHLKKRLGTDPHTGDVWGLERVVTTAEMAKMVKTKKGENNWAISNPEPIDGPDIDLPVDPYLLGAWLGDGSKSSGTITSSRADTCIDQATGVSDQEHMLAAARDAGYRAHAYPWSNKVVSVLGLQTDLRAAGVLGNKHIPAVYLRASFRQRLALLQGLMDTDGSVMASGTCSFPQVSKSLSLQVRELIESLGIKVGYATWDASYLPEGATEKKLTGTVHHLSFTTELPAFRLPRKLAKQGGHANGRKATRRYITSIEKIESVPTRCIAVNHPSHLFLAEGFIPTHNTNLARVLLGNASYGDRSSAFRSPDMAPQLTGAIPKGRGLWESLSSSAAVMAQTWYAPPTVLGAELLKRKPPLDPSQIVDMSDFGPPELDVTGAIITDSGLTEVTPAAPAAPGLTGPVEEVSLSLDELTSFATEEVIEEEVVLDLGDLVEFLDEDALDDLLPVSRTGGLNADDFGVDFSDVNVVDEPVTAEMPIADDAPAAAVPAAPAIPADPESEPFDWDAAEAAADEEDDEDTFAGFDLQEAAPVPTPAPSPVVDEPVSAPVADAPAPAPVAEAAIPADPDVVAVGSSVVWDEIDPTPWEPADGTGEYFWTEIDALMAFLDAYPHVMQVTWTDPLLFSEDPIGVRMIDIVADLGEERGVSLILPDEPTAPPVVTPPPAPAPPVAPVSAAPAQPALATNLPEDAAEASQPPAAPTPVAAHPPATPAPAVTSSDDEFDSIKRVPPHLLPTDNPFE